MTPLALEPKQPGEGLAHLIGRAFARFAPGESARLAEASAFLPRAITLEEMETPGVSRQLLWLGVAAVTGFGLWASLVRIDEVAPASGQIVPAAHVQPVQHPQGGVVAKIEVEDGQRVKQGELLVTLDGIDTRAELQSLLAREATLKLQAERLGAFTAKGRLAQTGSGFADLDRQTRAVFAAQAEALLAERAVLAAQTAQRESELQGAQARAKALEEQVALLRQDLAGRRPLVEKGIMSRLAYLSFERDLSRLEGEWADARSAVSRAEAALLESRGRDRQLQQDLALQASEQLEQVTSELAQVREQVRARQAAAGRLEVRAPVDGAVTGLAAVALNQVIAPGAAVAAIVPDGPMLAEVRVSPADIGYVKPGRKALVKVSAFNFSRFGGVEGEVRYVSAASFTDEQGRAYFKARIALDSDHVGQTARGLRISPGMSVVADIKTGSKTLAEYLFRPVSNALQDSFHER